MNAIEAGERLRELNVILPYIENAEVEAHDNHDMDAVGYLRKLSGRMYAERDKLHKKLSEVLI